MTPLDLPLKRCKGESFSGCGYSKTSRVRRCFLTHYLRQMIWCVENRNAPYGDIKGGSLWSVDVLSEGPLFVQHIGRDCCGLALIR